MKVKVLYFASLKDKIKKSSEELEVNKNTKVKDLKIILSKKYPEIKELLESCMIAINENYVDDNISLKENDIIAFIPPVGGG